MTTVLSLVGRAQPLPDSQLVDRLRSLQSALVSDAMGRVRGATGIVPVSGLSPGQIVAGPALTVRTRPGDNLAVHAALDLARAGEVLVVAAGGGLDRAVLGGLMGEYASVRGLVGIVVDGVVRDRSELARTAPPVFARGVNHLGPYKSGPGELRGHVVVGGLTVHDGDLVVCDEDGITAIPRHDALRIVEAAEQIGAAEAATSAAIRTGTWHRAWLQSVPEQSGSRG